MRPFSLTLGGDSTPWTRGLNTAKRPAELAPNEAVYAVGVDLSFGTIRGAWGNGSNLTVTLATQQKFAWYAGEDHWIATAYPDWACNDSALAGVGRTYRTAKATDITAGWPVYHLGADTYRLGLDYTTTAPSVVAGARSLNRSYAVTFYSPTTGFESNPTNRTATVKSGASLSAIPLYTVATPGSGTIHRRIYATIEGDPDGVLYYYATIADNTTTTYVDAGGALTSYAVDEDIDLDWGVGGNVDSETTPLDHSPPPFLTVLSEGMLGVTGEAGFPVGAVGSVVRWPHTGKPWAWPGVQQHDVQEYVEAVVIWQGQAFIFTAGAIWALSGAADYAMTPIKTGAAHGVKEGFGKTCKVTPWGIAYAAREGIALFDGTSSRIISKGVLDPIALYAGITYGNGVFYDGRYLFNPWGAGTCYELEMADTGLRVTMPAINAADFHVTPHANAAIGQDEPGLYVIWRPSGDIRPWRPADGDGVAGATRFASWIWKTALLTMGAPHRSKNFKRVRVSGKDLSLVFSVGDDLTLVSTATYVNVFSLTLTGTCQEFWLPAGFIGKALRVDVTATSESAELHEITIDGVILDGA